MQEIPGEQLRELARKMLAGTITREEQDTLEKWLNAHPGNELVWEESGINEEQLGNRIFRSVVRDARPQKRKKSIGQQPLR